MSSGIEVRMPNDYILASAINEPMGNGLCLLPAEKPDSLCDERGFFVLRWITYNREFYPAWIAV
jgi:hypothetical protein